MVANLPPQFHEKEAELKKAKTPEEKIAILEQLLTIMPKHKSSEKLQAEIKTKISRLRREMEKQPATARRQTAPSVPREGAAQVVICGPPNAGKSALLAALTRAEPEIADYPFTTKLPMPGMLVVRGVAIQLVDTPALSSEFSENWLGDILRKGDLLVFVFDLSSDLLLEQMEDSMSVLEQFLIKEPGRFAFAKKLLWVGNKADLPSAREVRQVFLDLYGEQIPDFLEVSAATRAGLDELAAEIHRLLDIIRVFTKSPGKPPDMDSPYAVPRATTVLQLAQRVHKDLAARFRYARLWRAQTVFIAGRDASLEDGDIVEIHTAERT